jgi:hypothetical protein
MTGMLSGKVEKQKRRCAELTDMEASHGKKNKET